MQLAFALTHINQMGRMNQFNKKPIKISHVKYEQQNSFTFERGAESYSGFISNQLFFLNCVKNEMPYRLSPCLHVYEFVIRLRTNSS